MEIFDPPCLKSGFARKLTGRSVSGARSLNFRPTPPAEKAKERMLAGRADPVANFPQGADDSGKTRDAVASIAGSSGRTVETYKRARETATPELMQAMRAGGNRHEPAAPDRRHSPFQSLTGNGDYAGLGVVSEHQHPTRRDFRTLFRTLSPERPRGQPLVRANPLISLVGTAGFELATPCTPCKCATRLRYVPKRAIIAVRQQHCGAINPLLRRSASNRLRGAVRRQESAVPAPVRHAGPRDRSC